MLCFDFCPENWKKKQKQIQMQYQYILELPESMYLHDYADWKTQEFSKYRLVSFKAIRPLSNPFCLF